jgi:hypothetical protein
MLLIMGESGTGKSTSMRNCDPATTAVVNPVGKPLPFKGKFTMLNSETDARKICKFMKEQAASGKKLLVVDDFQYILSVPYMNRIKESGWDKWNDFGANYFEIIEVCKDLPDDVVVAYMTHTETLENGVTTIKLIGKLLREKITIEGLFTTVLRTGVNEAKYYFYTQNSGKDTVKSPLGMFPAYAIENDLNYVADKMRNFYEVGEYKSDEEIAQADQAVAATEVEKPTSGRRSRGGSKAAAPKAEEPKTAENDSNESESGENSTDTTTDGAKTGRRSRSSRKASDKTHDEVVAENQQKVAEYMDACDKAVDEVADGAEEVEFDKAMAARDTVPQPDLQTPPRRTRRERQASASKAVCEADTYFYIAADDNYVMKHKGDEVPDGSQVITKEEFGEGVKRLAQAGNPKASDEPMNPPVSDEAPTEGTRTRRTRRTRS